MAAILSPTPRAADRVVFPGKVVRIASGPGGVLRTRDGQLWVTFENAADPDRWAQQDYFLSRGQGLCLAAGDVVVVGPSDSRYGMASFDWMPFGNVQPSMASRVSTALGVFARRWGPWDPQPA